MVISSAFNLDHYETETEDNKRSTRRKEGPKCRGHSEDERPSRHQQHYHQSEDFRSSDYPEDYPTRESDYQGRGDYVREREYSKEPHREYGRDKEQDEDDVYHRDSGTNTIKLFWDSRNWHLLLVTCSQRDQMLERKVAQKLTQKWLKQFELQNRQLSNKPQKLRNIWATFERGFV